MTKGEIYLYDYDDTLLKQRDYDCVSVRKGVIEYWEKLMGEKFQRMYIQIFPLTRTDLVNVRGHNCIRPTKEYKKEIKEPIKRFPAVYTNIKTYEYK